MEIQHIEVKFDSGELEKMKEIIGNATDHYNITDEMAEEYFYSLPDHVIAHALNNSLFDYYVHDEIFYYIKDN